MNKYTFLETTKITEPKLYMECHWMVPCKLEFLYVDMKFKMSTNVGLTVATMTWLTVMQYLCYNDNRYAPFVVITLWFFPYTWLITGFVTRVTRRVTRVQTVDSFMTYHWVCNKSNTTGDTCTDSIRILPVYSIYFILIYNLKTNYSEVNSCPILIIF